nr:MAG TPA: hypothetical protein [Caudoviricetes sp.]DAX11451.1 MAG TPA: hypothetical protein [Bacteriophage sp.]
MFVTFPRESKTFTLDGSLPSVYLIPPFSCAILRIASAFFPFRLKRSI